MLLATIGVLRAIRPSRGRIYRKSETLHPIVSRLQRIAAALRLWGAASDRIEIMEAPGKGRMSPCAACGHSCSVEAISCPNCGRPFSRAPESDRLQLDDSIYDRILTHSSMMIGMCLTLLGLIRVVEGVKSVSSMGDELLAINAIGFLASSILSYYAVKETDGARKRKKGRAGDILFSASLCLLAVICGILAFDLL